MLSPYRNRPKLDQTTPTPQVASSVSRVGHKVSDDQYLYEKADKSRQEKRNGSAQERTR
ncbi:MAG: hypothetical protein Ct9H300mP1_01280 [Planctomycetaceae bacterium]|nr:MAG: hypothetical protein Ct9H300mP1_01280 [Planctomycetaceae bacterium]